MEKEKQTPGSGALLLALRCSKASALLSSLRQPPRSTTTRRSSSSSSELELRNSRLLHTELIAARREAAGNARLSAAELFLVIAMVPLLFLFVGLLAAATVEIV